jgi:hypothetical protein
MESSLRNVLRLPVSLSLLGPNIILGKGEFKRKLYCVDEGFCTRAKNADLLCISKDV